MEKNPRHEYLDDTPLGLPTKFKRQSWIDNMREFVRSEMSRQADSLEAETFDEADDFWVDDDDTLPRTQYELEADQEYYVPPAPEPKPDPAPGSATPSPAPAAVSPEPGTEAG